MHTFGCQSGSTFQISDLHLSLLDPHLTTGAMFQMVYYLFAMLTLHTSQVLCNEVGVIVFIVW